MFQLVCDPSGVVVESTVKELVPSVIKWGNNLEHVLNVLLSHILGSAQVHVVISIALTFLVLGFALSYLICILLNLFSAAHLSRGLRILLSLIYVFWGKGNVGILMFY